jgi:hypothetical protein
MNTCKQESAVKIVRCPNFRKRLTDGEFRELVNELDDAETRAADLSRRVKDLIANALSGNSAHPSASHGESGHPSTSLEGEL